jgi:two-component system, cell cycle sensor histidine kinase and response regulator CckA
MLYFLQLDVGMDFQERAGTVFPSMSRRKEKHRNNESEAGCFSKHAASATDSAAVYWPVLDALSANSALLDDQGTILAVNQTWRDFAVENGGRAYAVPEGSNYLAVCDMAEGPDAETARQFAAGLRQVASGQIPSFELKYACHSPEKKRWFLGKVIPASDPLPGATLVIHEDITGLKNAEATLREKEAKDREFLESLPIGVYQCTLDGRVTYANAALAAMGGCPEEEGQQWFARNTRETYVHPEDQDRFREILLRDGRVDRFEAPFYRWDGSICWLSNTARLIYDSAGNPAAISGSFVDVTEQKAADDALRESEEKFRNIIESIQEGIIYTDRKGWILQVNDAVEDITGIPQGELLGRNAFAAARKFVSIRQLPHILRVIQDVLNGRPLRPFEFELDGKVLEISASYDTRKGNITGVLRDITDRRRLEEANEHRIIALTQPIETTSGIAFGELFNLDEIQRLQDDFAHAAGVASIITRPDGAPITKPGNFRRLCGGIIRQTEKGLANCCHSGAALGRYHPEGPIIQRCLGGGLWCAGAAISVGGRHIANWLIGQVRDENQTEAVICDYAREIGADEKETAAAFLEVPAMSRDQFEKAAKALFTLANQLSNIAYQNVQQARFIHDYQQAAEALRKSENTYRELIESANSVILRMDTQGTIRFINEYGQRLFGYSAEELTGRSVVGTIVPETERTGRNLQAMIADIGRQPEKYTANENENMRSGGERLWILWSNHGLRDESGNITEILSIGNDVTDRKTAEEERERLMHAIEQAAEIIVITNAEGVIQYANPAFEAITGYTREEAAGRNPAILKSGEQDAAFYENLWATLLRGEAWSGRFVNRKKDGSFYTEEAVISPVRDGAGRTVNYVAVKRDITSEIALEEQLRQAQKMEAVGRLTGGVAHDFNNLLQAINGYAELALSEVEETSPAGEAIAEVLQSGERAAHLVEQLLLFSRRQIMRPELLDLNNTIEEILRMLRRVIGEDIRIEWRPGSSTAGIYADGGMVEQALLNLCVNARDAMPAGGCLTISTSSGEPGPDPAALHPENGPGRYVLLRVADTGCGMEKDLIGRIFEPFFTTKETGKGTGLGLATVYGIIKQHDGLIDVSSAPGEGTVFRLYWPMAANPAPAEESRPPETIQGGTETILLAEDEENVRRLARVILEQAGYTVLVVRNGREAAALFEQRNAEISMALLDVVMPEMGGREAAEAMLALRPGLPVLFASGYSENADHLNFVAEKGLRLIRKPFNRAILLRAVREMLGQTSSSST